MEEQIYTDFTTKLLPKIQEGLSITKDYFLDLFSRYIKYLIITDSLYLALLIIMLLVIVYASRKIYIYYKSDDYAEYSAALPMLGLSICAFTVLFLIAIKSIDNLAKDIFIPEVRVYELIKGNNTNK